MALRRKAQGTLCRRRRSPEQPRGGLPAQAHGLLQLAHPPLLPNFPVCVFDYREARARRNAEDFLGGWSGAAMTDGYTAYCGLENVDNLACLVHIRRGFAKVIKAYKRGELDEAGSVAAKAVRMIDEVFEVERTFAGKSWEERTELRGTVTRGMLEDIGAWLAQVEPTLEPRMQLHKATLYALKHWGNVMKSADDGRYPLDNNLAERAIRPFAETSERIPGKLRGNLREDSHPAPTSKLPAGADKRRKTCHNAVNDPSAARRRARQRKRRLTCPAVNVRIGPSGPLGKGARLWQTTCSEVWADS